MKGTPSFPKPSPAEQDLHRLCDLFYEVLERRGEQAARALATKALAALKPDDHNDAGAPTAGRKEPS